MFNFAFPSIANMLAVVIIFAFFFMYFDDFSKKVRLKSPIAQY